MSQTRKQIMEVIIRSPESSLEEVVLDCPGLTWNMVFTEIDRMSRLGLVRLTAKGPGLYTMTMTTPRELSSGSCGEERIANLNVK